MTEEKIVGGEPRCTTILPNGQPCGKPATSYSPPEANDLLVSVGCAEVTAMHCDEHAPAVAGQED